MLAWVVQRATLTSALLRLMRSELAGVESGWLAVGAKQLFGLS
jgi:hypothetical protein